MKKKLVCLTLSILMLLTCVLTSCGKKETEENPDENAVDNSAKTITMWVMTEDETTPEAEKLVNEAFTKITKAKFKTNVVLNFCTEDEYYEKLEGTIEAAQADILLKEKADKELRMYIKNHKGEKDIADLKADFYAAHPEYQKFAGIEEEDDETAVQTEEETVLNDFGIIEIKYPDVKENQVDIFYLSGYDKYMEYYENEWLSSLSEELTTSSKKLTQYISTSLLNGVQIEGGVYAIPNNVPIGEYTYMMIDKALFDKYYCKIDSVNSVLDLSIFLNDMKQMNKGVSKDDPNYVVPLASSYEECMKMLCWYWELGYADQSVYNTYFDKETGRNYVLNKACKVKVEETDKNGETVEKEKVIIVPDVQADVVYKTNEAGQFVDANGKVLNYHYEIDEEGSWVVNEKGKTVYDKKTTGGMYLVDEEGHTVTAENDQRVKVEAETKIDTNGNVRPTYYYSYSKDCDFSILGTMMKDAASRTRGGINLGFNSLFTQEEYREMLGTLMDYSYNEYYGEVKEGQKAAVSFVKGDARIKQVYDKEGVYHDEKTDRDYYVVVAEYPEATEEELYGNMFAVYGNSVNLSRSMEVITYLNTNSELRDLLQYGILGRHYELTEEGTVHLLNGEDETAGVYRMDIHKTGNCFIATPDEKSGTDAWKYAKIQNNDSLINPLLGFDFNVATADSDYSLDVDLIDHINKLSAEAWKSINECADKNDLMDLIGNMEDGFVKKFAPSAGDEKLKKATNPNYNPDMPLGEAAGEEQTPDKSGSSPYTVYQTWLTTYGYAYVPQAED